MKVTGPPFYDENEWEPDEPVVVAIHGTSSGLLNALLAESLARNGYQVNNNWYPASPSPSYVVTTGPDGKQYITDVDNVTYLIENGEWIRQ